VEDGMNETRCNARSYRHKGFTLIELLVVIAIIAILTAIIFPVFATAREKARQASCASNLKQLALAFTQYEQDFDEMVPCGTIDVDYGGNGWAAELYPYLKSKDVYTCPDDKTTPVAVGAVTYYPLSYGLNSVVAAPGGAGTIASHPIPISKMTAPVSTVLLFEVSNSWTQLGTGVIDGHSAASSGVHQDNCNDMYGKFQSSPFTNVNSGTPQFAEGAIGGMGMGNRSATVGCSTATSYHSTGNNYVACDGHVKFLPPSKISTGPDPGKSGCVQDGCIGTLNYNASSTDTLTLNGAQGSAPVVLTFAFT